MVFLREFQFSSELFGGLLCKVDLDECETLPEVVEAARQQLLNTLRCAGLPRLTEIAENRAFGIHDLDFGQLFIDEKPVYICEHGITCRRTA